MLSAQVLDLYGLWPPLDIPMHFFGGVVPLAFVLLRKTPAPRQG